jgi:hypothetical protein
MRLAVILGAPWRGGMLRTAFALAALLRDLCPGGQAVDEVVLGLPAGAYADSDIQAGQRAATGTDRPARITLRPFTMRRLATADLLLTRSPVPAPFARSPEVTVPDDGGHCFRDCDGVVLIAPTQQPAPILVERPYVSFVADLLLRYVPAFLQTADSRAATLAGFQSLRAGRAVFATTRATAEDVVGYAGLPRAAVMLMPLLRGPAVPMPPAPGPGRHILWITNPSPHKNHLAAVTALEIYCADHGGALPVIVAGEGSDRLGLAEGRLAAGNGQTHPFHLPTGRLDVRGHVSDASYRQLVADAAIVWHNVIADNGSYVAFDAAAAGRHLVSSDYPQMREWCDRYGIAAGFFPAHDPARAAALLRETELQAAAGIRPAHALRADSPADIAAAYTALLERLL